VKHDNRPLTLGTSDETLFVLIIRIICLALLGYWSFVLIRPFLAIIVWSIIIAVAVYPIFETLSTKLKLYGHRTVEAVTITVFGVLVILGMDGLRSNMPR
jgi:predicted PurR-regulated permease PerM